MTYKELQKSFELEATSKYSNIADDKPTSYEIEYWINIGYNNWIDSHYTGYNIRLKGLS